MSSHCTDKKSCRDILESRNSWERIGNYSVPVWYQMQRCFTHILVLSTQNMDIEQPGQQDQGNGCPSVLSTGKATPQMLCSVLGATRDKRTILNCARGGWGWTSGGISPRKGSLNIGMDCPRHVVVESPSLEMYKNWLDIVLRLLWSSWHGDDRSKVGLNDLIGLFQLKWFCDSASKPLISWKISKRRQLFINLLQ